MKYSFLVISFFGLFNQYCNCQNKTLENHLDCLQKINQNIPNDTWNIESAVRTNRNTEYYYLTKKDKNVYYSLHFEYYPYEDVPKCDKYRNIELGIIKEEDPYKHYILIEEDTMYHYRMIPGKPNTKYFYQGYYYYLVSVNDEIRKLDSCQYNYITNHLDSLIHLQRGVVDLDSIRCN